MSTGKYPESPLNVPVSYFRNYLQTHNPVTVNLLDILNTSRHREAVEQIRLIENKQLRNDEKAMLPAYTPSGTFSHRADNGLLQHSGLLQIDVDFQENEEVLNYDSLKEELAKLQNVAYCGLSVSGKGYFCLIPIAFPEKHRAHFRALQRIFAAKNLIIDPTCINVSRLRGVSYDPAPHFNHQARVFTLYDEEYRAEAYQHRNTGIPEGKLAEKVDALVRAVEKKHIDLTSDYLDWFKLGCSLANSMGEDGREYFHRLSQFHPEYSRRRADLEYDKCLKKPYNYSAGTLFYNGKQAGIYI